MTHSGRTPPYSPEKMGHLAHAWCCNGGDVLLDSSKTQPALLDMLPPCDVGISPLTGVRPQALGKPASQVLGPKCVFSSEGFGHHFLVLLILAHLGTSRDKSHGS